MSLSKQAINSENHYRIRNLKTQVADLKDHTPAEFPLSCGDMAARLNRELVPAVRDAILTALTYLSDQTAVAGLVECLRSRDAALRGEAVDAMTRLPKQIVPIMGGLLNDANPDVRIFAVNILESLQHSEVEAWLNKVIEQDPHINVCATAADLLVELGTAASRPALERLKARFPNEPYIHFAVDLALKRISMI
jgi:hypothetical protein